MISVIGASPAWWEIKLTNKILASSTWLTCRPCVIGAVIFQPQGQSLTITSFPPACHQHTSHAQCNSCVASDKVKAGKRRQHLCNFTLLPHVHASFVTYSPFVSISFFSSLHWHHKTNVWKHVSICVLCVCLNNGASESLVACVLVWLCWGAANSTQKETSKAYSRKVNNCES